MWRRVCFGMPHRPRRVLHSGEGDFRAAASLGAARYDRRRPPPALWGREHPGRRGGAARGLGQTHRHHHT